jgi:ELWxxDGT repeat protein
MGRMSRRGPVAVARHSRACPNQKIGLESSAARPMNRVARCFRISSLEALEPRALLSTVAATLVNEINTVDAFPAELTPAGTNLFYTVEGSEPGGTELAVTTSGGTSRLLEDFVPGQATASASYPYDAPTGPEDLNAVGNSVYFLASDGTNHDVLWTSDGTTTRQVAFSDPTDSSATVVANMAAVGTSFFFTSADPLDPSSGQTSRTDLWCIHPGITQPVLAIADIAPAQGVGNFTAVGSLLYFTVSSGANESELWASDGTPTGTNPVTYIDPTSDQLTDIDDINQIIDDDGELCLLSWAGGPTLETMSGGQPVTLATFSGGDAPADFTVAGSNLFFVASDATHGRELWVTNGTAQGTELVNDILPGPIGSYPTNLTNANGTLYFTATGSNGQNELWRSDGTAQGTTLVADLPGQPSGGDADSGYGYGYGMSARPAPALAASGSTVYFANSDPTHGDELWSTSLTEPPALVANIDSGSASSAPHDFVAFSGGVYFAAHDGSTPQQNELWETTGSSIALVKSFSPSATDGSYVADEFAEIGSHVLFVANDGIDGPAVWSTDGTSAGTMLVAAADPTGFAALGGSAYFLTATETTTTLWESNGTASGTAIVATLPDGLSGYNVFGPQVVAAGGKVFFVTSDGTRNGEDLWTSNGTAAGTTVAKDFNLTAATGISTDPELGNLTTAGALLYFTANNGIGGDQLWTSDGTQLGTVMVSDINPTGSGGDPSDLTPVGSSVYFVAYDSSDNAGLWITNGHLGGTSLVKSDFPAETLPVANPYPGQPATQSVSPSITELAAVGSTLYLTLAYVPAESTGTASDQYQLWASNGSYAGTSQVVAAGVSFQDINALIPLGSVLLFVANDGTHGNEIWRTDGTAAGTMIVKDINSGPASSIANYQFYNKPPVENNGVLYFAATDGTPGQEIWQTDGTAADTSMVADINPGEASAPAVPVTILGGGLLVFADDGTHGQALLSISSRVAPVIASVSPQTIVQGQTVSLDLGELSSDTSVPRQVLTYSLAAGAPAGAAINPTTGVFTWTAPLSVPVASYAITAIASDGESSPMTAVQTFTVNVVYGGPPPDIVSTSLNTKRGVTTITLNFSQPLEPGPAGSTGDYQLVVPPKTRRGKPKTVPLTPHYTAGSMTVTLTTRSKLSFSPALELTVLGSAHGELANLYGSLLDGDSNFLALVTKRGLTPVTSFPVAGARTSARAVVDKTRSRAVPVPAGPRAHIKDAVHSAKRPLH